MMNGKKLNFISSTQIKDSVGKVFKKYELTENGSKVCDCEIIVYIDVQYKMIILDYVNFTDNTQNNYYSNRLLLYEELMENLGAEWKLKETVTIQ